MIRAYLDDLQKFGIKLGLDKVRTLASAFGDPHRAYPSIHVAGTNGKGSTCAMLAEILKRSGFRAGLYTSPHLVRVEERVRIGGRLIAGPAFDRLLAMIKDRVAGLLAAGTIESPPTYFEVVTMLAFLYFQEKRVDLAILETGLGGRFDATNIAAPLVSVITTVSKDHQEHLGGTIARIASEKAGIIKPGVPVVCGVEGGAARRVIRGRAREEGAPFIPVFGGTNSFVARRGRAGVSFVYRHAGEEFRFSPGLAGFHQGRNGAVAAAAARTLSRVWRPISRQAIVRGIEDARWEGRLEEVARRPRVLLDGAHNEDGIKALRAYIEDACPRPPVVIFAMMKDKAVGRAAEILFPAARWVVLTAIPFARAASPREILSRARPFADKIVVEPEPARALAAARRLAGPDGTVIAAGSLYLVGELKKVLA